MKLCTRWQPWLHWHWVEISSRSPFYIEQFSFQLHFSDFEFSESTCKKMSSWMYCLRRKWPLYMQGLMTPADYSSFETHLQFIVAPLSQQVLTHLAERFIVVLATFPSIEFCSTELDQWYRLWTWNCVYGICINSFIVSFPINMIGITQDALTFHYKINLECIAPKIL